MSNIIDFFQNLLFDPDVILNKRWKRVAFILLFPLYILLWIIVAVTGFLWIFSEFAVKEISKFIGVIKRLINWILIK